jgi:eukaryotic-like serine/threonine-protein kinase
MDLVTIVAAAAQKPAAERAAYLDEACGADADLRRKAERLLKAHDEAGEFLESPAHRPAGTIDYATITERVGSKIGPYMLREQIGEGGFGLVFVAEQTEPVKRKVALKVIKPGMDSQQVIRRFEAERQALALMDHPNIAKVLDAGATESGRPYFVMELVRGIPITEYCDQNQLSPRDRLDLFVTVCQAIQHAHQKGIIHRDIKPSNVLVTSHDGKPVAKVIDFGIAKAIHQHLTERTIYTNFAQMVGTPLYMSPEQAEMSGLDIDTRSDIYSLGVLLYELLTGTTPFDKKRLREAAYDEIRRLIREVEPPKPSTRLNQSTESLPSVAAQRRMEPAKLSKLVRGDLDWITMKALEKDRTRRYETANGLARDIQRYLSDEPVEACPPSTTYRLRKFARKHRTVLATAGTIALLLLAGVAASTWQAVRARRAQQAALLAAHAEAEQREFAEQQRDRAAKAEDEATRQRDLAVLQKHRADEEATIAKAVNDFLRNDLLAEAAPDRNPRASKVTVEEILGKSAARIGGKFERQPLVEAAIRMTIGETYGALGQFAIAQSHLETALQLRSRALGDDHPDTLTAMNSLAELYFRQGQFDKAESLFQKALAGRRRVLGDENPATLISLNNLAFLFQARAELAKAEPLFAQVLALRSRLLGHDHPDTLISMNSLGEVYFHQARFAEAEMLFLDTLRLRRSFLGGQHSDTITSINNLGYLYEARGEFNQAEPLFREALDSRRRILGEEHPDTLVSVNNLAQLLYRVGRFDSAESLFTTALETRRRVLGEDHPDTLASLNDLAFMQQARGQFASAEALLAKALEGRRRALGSDHPDTLVSMNSLARCLVDEGQFAQAEALARELLEISQKSSRADSLIVARALGTLGAALLKQKKYSDAERYLRECLAICRNRKLDAWTTFDIESKLGGTVLSQKRFADAEPLLLNGYEGMKRRVKTIPKQGTSCLLEAIERLVQLYEATNRPDEVAKWKKELDELRSPSKP